jgi:site-specific DNA recombinase
MDRLLTAYQEDLLSLDELRRRMPELRQREQTLQAELQSILDQTNDHAVHLRLAETLSSFLARLRTVADTLDIEERQRIARLVIKEILVGDETIVIQHSIPLSTLPSNSNGSQSTPSGPEHPAMEVTFCVQGVITPPCGVPRFRSSLTPSRSMGAVNHLSM